MSKSKGHVIYPDDIFNDYGADALRTYEMFIGDYEKDASWSTNGLKGCKKFLDRIWRLGEHLNENKGYTNEVLVHQTIKKVSNDLETMKYNTAVSALMILLNDYEKHDTVSKDDLRVLIALLNPIAPHITEEINEKYILGKPLCESSWPEYDENKTVNSTFELVIQVNGKVRGREVMSMTTTKEQMEAVAMENENVKKFLTGKKIVNVVVIPNKLVNIVVK